MKTFHTFKDVAHFEKFLREKHANCHPEMKYGGCLDYVKVGGILFTMHEYDMDGKLLTWANKKHNLMIEVETSDRYKNGYTDAKAFQFEPYYLRSDIQYAQ